LFFCRRCSRALIANASRHHDRRGDGIVNLQVPLSEEYSA